MRLETAAGNGPILPDKGEWNVPTKNKPPKKSIKVSDLDTKKKGKDVKGGVLSRSTHLK